MEEIVYKFLDDYLGDEVFYEKESVNRWNRYYIYSKKNKVIILFFHRYGDNEHIKIYRGNSLTNTVSKFFDMDTESVTKIIRNWFGDKHNLKKVSDLLSFISEEDLVKN